MLLAILADTHLPRGQRALPASCREHLERADLILHAGDFVEVGVLEEIERHGRVEAVVGNQDSAELCARLPETRVVEADGARIAMIHDSGAATGRLERMRRRFPDVDAVVFGHSHMPLTQVADDRFQIFNPGSPTDKRRRALRHTMGFARVQAGELAFELIELD